MNNATRWATAALVAVSLTTASTARAAIQVAVLDGRFHASADDKLGFASREFADPANGNVTLEALDGSA